MPKSTVYFADFRSSDSENLQQKFARLLKTAGLAKPTARTSSRSSRAS